MFFFAHSPITWIIIKQIYFIHIRDTNRYNHFRLKWTKQQWRTTMHSLDCQNWSLVIRCSFVSYPSHPFLLGVLSLSREYSQHILSPTNRVWINASRRLTCKYHSFKLQLTSIWQNKTWKLNFYNNNQVSSITELTKRLSLFYQQFLWLKI